MSKIFPDYDFLSSLDWQSVGEIAYSSTIFGLIIKSYGDEYWIVKDNGLYKLTYSPENKQLLVSGSSDLISSYLGPYSPDLIGRLISWLSGGASEVLNGAGNTLANIKEEKSRALEQFIEADITIECFIKTWNDLQVKEANVLVNNIQKNQNAINASRRRYRLTIVIVAVFFLGVLVGKAAHQSFGDYDNAEECILGEGGSRFSAAACYELFPSVNSH